MSMHSNNMAEPLTLTEIERGEESCVLRFSDGESFQSRDILPYAPDANAQNVNQDKKMSKEE